MARRQQQAMALGEGGADRVRGEVISLRIFDSLWGIATVRTPSEGARTITGKLLGVRLGDSIEAVGAWTTHPRYGEQLKAREVSVVAPADAAGVIAWLESKIPSIGRTRATEMVKRFGVEGVWEAIEERPDELLEIAGITAARRDAIVEAYRQQRGDRDRLVRLKGYGLTDGQIAKLTAAWGEDVESVLRENPYRLAEEVRGFGFQRADAVALKMGLSPTSPARIRAALLHVLDEGQHLGHVFVPRGKMIALAAKCLGFGEDQAGPSIARELEALEGAGKTVRRGAWIYARELDAAETEVAAAIRRLTGGAA